MEKYKKAYQQLVADVGDALRTADVEKLDYFYKKSLRRPLAQADTPWSTGLGLLRALEEAGLFSYSRPEGLARAMTEIKREDQMKVVDDFVATHRQFISHVVRGEKRMPATVTDKDGPYPPRHKAKLKGVTTATVTRETPAEDADCGYTTFIHPSRVPLQVSSESSSPPPSPLTSTKTKTTASGGGVDENDDDYSYAYSHMQQRNRGGLLTTTKSDVVSPESSLSSTSPPVSLLSSDGGVKTADGSSDDEDDCYYQGSRESWLTTANTQHLKLSQKLQLKTGPLQDMVRKQENHTRTCDLIKWQLFQTLLILKLHIDPIGCHGGIAATLYLQKPVKTAITGLLTAELTVSQPRRQPIKKPSITKPSSSSVTLFQSSVLMDIPDENTPPFLPSVVARFPMILSHKNLLNNALVHGPLLDISLTLRQNNT